MRRPMEPLLAFATFLFAAASGVSSPIIRRHEPASKEDADGEAGKPTVTSHGDPEPGLAHEARRGKPEGEGAKQEHALLEVDRSGRVHFFHPSCWDQCNGKSGFCKSCGEEPPRACCKAGHGGPPECNGGGCHWYHCCIDAKRDCAWKEWEPFGTCTRTCGGGRKTRSRQQQHGAQHGGSPCSGPSSEETACNKAGCPVNCEWKEWASFDTCTKTCGVGTQTRKRDKKPQENGGNPCSGAEEETKNCNTEACPTTATKSVESVAMSFGVKSGADSWFGGSSTVHMVVLACVLGIRWMPDSGL